MEKTLPAFLFLLSRPAIGVEIASSTTGAKLQVCRQTLNKLPILQLVGTSVELCKIGTQERQDTGTLGASQYSCVYHDSPLGKKDDLMPLLRTVFPIFNIVRFKNDGCRSTSTLTGQGKFLSYS